MIKTKTCSRDKWIFLIYINLITSYNTYHHRSTLLHIHTYLVVTFFHKAAFSLLFDLSWCDSARFTTGTSIDSQYLFFLKRWRFEHRMVSYFVFSAMLWKDPRRSCLLEYWFCLHFCKIIIIIKALFTWWAAAEVFWLLIDLSLMNIPQLQMIFWR